MRVFVFLSLSACMDVPTAPAEPPTKTPSELPVLGVEVETDCPNVRSHYMAAEGPVTRVVRANRMHDPTLVVEDPFTDVVVLVGAIGTITVDAAHPLTLVVPTVGSVVVENVGPEPARQLTEEVGGWFGIEPWPHEDNRAPEAALLDQGFEVHSDHNCERGELSSIRFLGSPEPNDLEPVVDCSETGTPFPPPSLEGFGAHCDAVLHESRVCLTDAGDLLGADTGTVCPTLLPPLATAAETMAWSGPWTYGCADDTGQLYRVNYQTGEEERSPTYCTHLAMWGDRLLVAELNVPGGGIRALSSWKDAYCSRRLTISTSRSPFSVLGDQLLLGRGESATLTNLLDGTVTTVSLPLYAETWGRGALDESHVLLRSEHGWEAHHIPSGEHVRRYSPAGHALACTP